MSETSTVSSRILKGNLNAKTGELGSRLKAFGPDIIIGHPTFNNEDNIGAQLKAGIAGAVKAFPGQKIAFLVSDGSYTEKSGNTKTIDAAIQAAETAIRSLNAKEQEQLFFFAGPYDGYNGDFTPGKGSALKLIFEEMGRTRAKTLILLDGDLKNDMAQWQGVFQKVIKKHDKDFPGKDFFITARYARHFVDASLTRNVVGPLTTLMGTYVPGGISGDIVLSGGAVALERAGEWGEARRKYGTDISTTFDNIANGTVIYEIFLGAKLHDVTDDAKLTIMPGEVIGAALDRILHYEEKDNRVTNLLKSDQPLKQVVKLGPEFTGISFINPGETSVFNLQVKRKSVSEKFDQFKDNLKTTLTAETFDQIFQNHETLVKAVQSGSGKPLFLGISSALWTQILYEVLGYLLVTKDITNSKLALNYLYTAAFLEFCAQKLDELGYKTPEQIEAAQATLGVGDEEAEAFYENNVDKVVLSLAMNFFEGRKKILERMEGLEKK